MGAQPNCYTVYISDRGDEKYLRQPGHLRVDGDRLSVASSSNHTNPQLLAPHATCARHSPSTDRLARLLEYLVSPFTTIPGVIGRTGAEPTLRNSLILVIRFPAH